MLSLDRLVEGAQKRTALEDFGQGPDIEWLELFIDEVNQQGLNEADEKRAAKRLRAAIEHRLLLHAVQPEVPHHRDVTMILGLPRTGSTHLFDLMALQNTWRFPTFAEARWPLARHANQWDELHDEAAKTLEIMEAFTDIPKRHPMWVDGPEECRILMEPSWKTVAWSFQYQTQEYADALECSNMKDSWQVMSRVLAAIDSSAPSWLLKEVGHPGHVESLIEAFPGIRIIWIHRDPVESIPSTASLCSLVQRVTKGEADDKLNGNAILAKSYADLRHMHRILDNYDNVMNVDYEDLTSDPVGLLDEVLGFCGGRILMERDAMQKWVDDHPKDLHGKHVINLKEFDLSEDRIRRTMGGLR